MASNSQLGTWGKDDRGYHYWKIRIGGRDAKPIVIKRKVLADLKTEVKKRIAELDAKGKLDPVSHDPTVKQKLTNWLADRVKGNGANSTYRYHNQNCQNYIFPHLGKTKLSKLNSDQIQSMISALKRQGLADSTVRGACVTLFAALGKRKSIDLKEDLRIPSAGKPRDRVLSDGDMARVLEECQRMTELKTRPGEFQMVYRDGHLLVFLLNNGMRISEALGTLQVKVNLNAQTIDVTHQLEWIPDEEKKRPPTWKLSELKSEKSERILYLNDDCIEAIRLQMVMTTKEFLKAGRGYEENGLLFPTESGKPMTPRNVYRSLQRVLTALEIEPVSIHDLRRSYLTYLADKESRMHVVRDIAGHASATTTMRVYSVARERAKKEATTNIDLRKLGKVREEKEA